MGKMKISNNKRKTNGMPTWLLSLIIVAVLVAVVVACLSTVIGSWGIIPRLTTAIKSENYSINENMMSYFFQSAYSEFTSSTTYTTFKSNCSLNTGSNKGLPLDEQVIGGGTYDYLMAPDHDGKTWHEFFVSKTEEKAKTVLSYCEEARARNLSLGATETAELEKELESLFATIKYSIYMQSYDQQALYLSDKECVSYYFGKGVSVADIEDALELITLAGMAEDSVRDQLGAAITADRILAEYTENAKKYDYVDYLNYSFTVKYDQVSKDVLAGIGEDAKAEDHEAEILEAYKAEIAKTIQRAEALSKITDKKEFIKQALTYFLEDEYEDTYSSVKEKEKLDDAKCPTAENIAKIKDGMIAKLFEELLAEDRKDTSVDDVEEKEEKFYAYGVEVTKEYGKFLNSLKSSLYSDLIYEEEYVFSEKSTYPTLAEDEEEKENIKWLYDSARKEGDSVIIDEGDGAKGAEVKVDKKSYKSDVYCIVKPRYVDETIVRHGAYMIFTSADTAKKALEELKKLGSVTLESFLEVAANSGAGNYTELENYAKGQIGSDKFDEWMYDDSRKKGDYTDEVITISSSYVLGYFEEVGTLKAWEANVKNALLTEDLTEETARINKTYAPTIEVKTNVMNRLGK
ncbi:MAG: hypothetical protein E7642_05530 [Ruminococcaceae bacterium]|nr:hypothetical protein [Oscillospiraceae bacterium]